jgi:hypothetical protein
LKTRPRVKKNHINLNLTPVVEIISQVCMYVWLNFGWLFEFLTHGCCEATSVREFLWLLECGGCGAVKQWKMTSLLCAHCLAANRAFQNRKSGYSTRSFFWFGKRSTTNGKIHTVPFAKTTANCFNSFCHFHLISSVSRPCF